MAVAAAAKVASAPKLPPCGFLVSGGKNGNVPVKLEKRPKGKKVTLIANVQGSAKSLLSALTSLLGTGGTVRQEASGCHWTVEIQGDQTERVTAALVQLGCLRGVKKPAEENEKKKTVEVASRVCGYDKFLRKSEPEKRDNGSEALKSLALSQNYSGGGCLPDADCNKWHGAWFYCRGRCMQSDMNDVWEENLREQDGHCRSSSSSAPKPAPSSVAELNITLRNLGLLPEVGGAHRLHRLTRNPAEDGMTLDQYRRAAMAPGARLVCDVGPPKSGRREGPKQISRDGRNRNFAPSQSVKAPAKPVPRPKAGTFGCPVCHCVFGLQKTLKLHIQNAHGGCSVPPPKTSSTAPPAAQKKTNDRFYSSYSLPKSGGDPEASNTGLAWERGEMVAPKNPPKPGWQLSEALPEAVQKQPKEQLATLSSGSASSKAKKRATNKKMGVCPVCAEMFEEDYLDSHVEECLAQTEGPCVASDEEIPSHNADQQDGEERDSADDDHFQKSGSQNVDNVSIGSACRISQDHVPTAADAGSEIMISVKKGEKVFLHWLQEDERCYWAYVSTSSRNGDPQQWGYVPTRILRKVDEATSPVLAPKASPTLIEEKKSEYDNLSTDGVPEEWLLDLLNMDLGEEKSTLFWGTFRDLRPQMPLGDAWTRSLEVCRPPEVCCYGEEGQNELSELVYSNGNDIDVQEYPELTHVPLHRKVESTTSRNAPMQLEHQQTHLDVSRQGDSNVGTSNRWKLRSRKADTESTHFEPPLVKPTESSACQRTAADQKQIAGMDQDSERAPVESAAWSTRPRNATHLRKVDTEAPRSESSPCKSTTFSTASRNGAGLKTPDCGAVLPEPTSSESSGSSKCPICGRDVSKAIIEQHVSMCADKKEAERLYAKKVSQWKKLPQLDETWAREQIRKLVARYCVSPVDPSVALASLNACVCRDEMRNEAILLFGDNQLVKNFAYQFWDKKR